MNLRSNFLPHTTRLLVVVWATVLSATQVYAQSSVHRCVDDAGKVSYQAQPCQRAEAGRRVDVGGASEPPKPQGRTVGGDHGERHTRNSSARFQEGEAASAPAASFQGADQPAQGLRREVSQRGGQVQAPIGTKPSRVLQPVASPEGMQRWGEQGDVIVVSGNEAQGRPTRVHLNHPGRPVLLVLATYRQAQWQVLPAPGTTLLAVVVSARDGQSSATAPAGVPVVIDDLPYAYETANINFRRLISLLNSRYGVNRITGYRGGYNLPDLVPVTGPFPPDPAYSLEGLRPEVPRARISFDLVSTDGRRLPWTNAGPKDAKKQYVGVVRGGGMHAWPSGAPAAVSEDGGEAYALEGNGGRLAWFPQGLGSPTKKYIEVPKNLPELSWGSAMAWNTRKGILALVSFGGEGFFYRYDTRSHQWLTARSLQNRDLISLAHDSVTGNYLGLSNAGELLVFNERGELDDVRPLADVLPDLGSVYDKGNSRLDGLSLAVQGDVVAVVCIQQSTVTHIWTYELGRRKAQLTYKALL